MAEFDLIPAGYWRSTKLRRLARRLAVVSLSMLGLLIIAEGALLHAASRVKREVEALRRVEQIERENQARVELLEGERRVLEAELAALDVLRGGAPVREILLAVDRALSEQIRFGSWSFRRAGERVESEPETVHTGYFLVVPARGKDQPEEAWMMQTNMEIRGQAESHVALAGFVQRLVRQPEIHEVHIRNTRLQRSRSTELISFELAVVVKGSSA